MATRQTPCAACPYEWSERFCRRGEGKAPANCPSLLHRNLVKESLAGIATRNSILLIEFVEAQKSKGEPLVKSLIEAGALRTRPIFLTSLAAMLAARPITLDPIFSGLAWALIFGRAVSTFFTLVVVPLVYFMAYGSKET